MSAGMGTAATQVSRDMGLLAPKFRAAVEAGLVACRAQGLNAIVYEGYRTQALQEVYYARGRTVIPPLHTVTNAATNLQSWHGYGLAVDLVEARHFWTPPEGEAWFKKVADIIKGLGLCKWGGDWIKPDTPHFQWHLCKPSPSDDARRTLAQGGVQAVWAALQAV